MHDTKERLSLLWLFALLNYLYADVVALFAIVGSRNSFEPLLTGHPDAKRATHGAMSPDSKRRFFAVLHVGGITGPREAVRAAIVAEARRKQ
jgi:hypothetical protein